MGDAPAEFNGLYVPVNALAVLDTKAALNLGYGYDSALPGPHGTYTRIPFFFVRTEDLDEGANTVQNGALTIFDHNGDCCRLTWNDRQNAWVSDPSSFSFPCKPNATFPGQESSLAIWPTLVLDVYGKADAPSGAEPGDAYIRSQPLVVKPDEPPSFPKTQKVRFDHLTGKLTWFTDHYPNGLEFEEAKAQPHEDCSDGQKCFGDVFQVQDHGYAQLAFPFCGFKPAALTTAGPQWTGISAPGTSSMYDSGRKDGGDKQDYGGTLIFEFPARDSRDYMDSENVPGQPYFPLGFRARRDAHTFGEMLSQLISTSQEEMNSWKVGLGLSGGMDKVLNVGLSGSYENSSSISRESASRYAVTRDCGVNWVAITDPPNLSLHSDFVKEVESRLARWMATDAHTRSTIDFNWKGFVDRFGTHYLHAMTHGWIKISTQVFSLQAESVAEKQGWNLQVTAKGNVEAMSGKAQASLEHTWEQKFGTKVESDTVRYSELGDPTNPVAIFLDLRPMSELFSPVFFRYNPADDFGSLAPAVWYDLRASFAQYLDRFPAPTLIDYSPSTFHFRILSITSKINLKEVGYTIPTYASGTVTISVDSGAGGNNPTQVAASGTMTVPRSQINDLGFHPDASFFATVAISRSFQGQVKLCIEMDLSMEMLGRTSPPGSKKYSVSLPQTATSGTAGDDFVDIAWAFGPAPA